MQAVVFTSPGSPGLPAIMSTVKARGWSASLFLQDLDPACARFATRRLRDFILVPDGAAPAHPWRPAPRTRERVVFADALARDMAQYRGAAQQVDHAAEI